MLSDILSSLKILIQEDKTVLEELRSLSSRVYSIEQDHRLMIGECRRLAAENLRLQNALKQVVLLNDVPR